MVEADDNGSDRRRLIGLIAGGVVAVLIIVLLVVGLAASGGSTAIDDGVGSRASPPALAGLISRIKDNTISSKIAKTVFEAMVNGEGSADTIIESKGLKQVTDSGAIEKLIDTIIAANPKQLEQYRSGQDKVFTFFVGQVMKESKGKANPAQVNDILLNKLKK